MADARLLTVDRDSMRSRTRRCCAAGRGSVAGSTRPATTCARANVSATPPRSGIARTAIPTCCTGARRCTRHGVGGRARRRSAPTSRRSSRRASRTDPERERARFRGSVTPLASATPHRRRGARLAHRRCVVASLSRSRRSGVPTPVRGVARPPGVGGRRLRSAHGDRARGRVVGAHGLRPDRCARGARLREPRSSRASSRAVGSRSAWATRRRSPCSPTAHDLRPGTATARSRRGAVDGASLARDVPGHTEAIEEMDVTPDGRSLLSVSDDGSVLLWDLRNPSRPTPTELGTTADIVWSVTVSPDGSTAATVSEDGTITLWDLAAPDGGGDVLTTLGSTPSPRRSRPTARLLMSGRPRGGHRHRRRRRLGHDPDDPRRTQRPLGDRVRRGRLAGRHRQQRRPRARVGRGVPRARGRAVRTTPRSTRAPRS